MIFYPLEYVGACFKLGAFYEIREYRLEVCSLRIFSYGRDKCNLQSMAAAADCKRWGLGLKPDPSYPAFLVFNSLMGGRPIKLFTNIVSARAEIENQVI